MNDRPTSDFELNLEAIGYVLSAGRDAASEEFERRLGAGGAECDALADAVQLAHLVYAAECKLPEVRPADRSSKGKALSTRALWRAAAGTGVAALALAGVVWLGTAVLRNDQRELAEGDRDAVSGDAAPLVSVWVELNRSESEQLSDAVAIESLTDRDAKEVFESEALAAVPEWMFLALAAASPGETAEEGGRSEEFRPSGQEDSL